MGTGALRKTLPIAVLGLSAAGLGAAAITLGNGEAVVERGFQRAIANMDADAGARRAAPVVAGSEEFWLTHVVHDAGPATAKAVSVGDRITISSNGTQRVLNVVTVDRLDNQVLPVSSTAGRPSPLILVTCRDEANAQARPVRFLLEAGEEFPALSAVKTGRTL